MLPMTSEDNLPASVGDGVIFDGETIHCGPGPSASGEPRVSFFMLVSPKNLQSQVPNQSLYSTTPTKESKEFEETNPPRTDFQISAANAVHHWSDALSNNMAGDAALMEWYDYAPWVNWSYLEDKPPSTEEFPNKYADLCKRILIMKYTWFPELPILPFQALITYNSKNSVKIGAEIEAMGGQVDGDGAAVAGEGHEDSVDATRDSGQSRTQRGKRKMPCDSAGLAKARAPLPPSHNTRGRRGIGAAYAPDGLTTLRTRGQHLQVGMDPGPSQNHDPPTTARGRVPRPTKSGSGGKGRTATMSELD